MSRDVHHGFLEVLQQVGIDIAYQVAETVEGNDDPRDFSRGDVRFVEPGRCPVRCGSADRNRRRASGRKFGCNRRENIATMKIHARFIDTERLETSHVEFEYLCPFGAIEHPGEQAVVGSNKIMIVVIDDQDVALRANARVNDRKMYAARWEVAVRTTDPETGLGRPLRCDVVCEVDHPGFGKARIDDAFHHCRERAFVTEISGDCDDSRSLHR